MEKAIEKFLINLANLIKVKTIITLVIICRRYIWICCWLGSTRSVLYACWFDSYLLFHEEES